MRPWRAGGARILGTPEPAQVLDLADRVPGRYRALILLAAFTGLRYGELAALRRRHLAVKATSVTVVATVSNFQRATSWTATVTAAGLPGFHLHDLRHTGKKRGNKKRGKK